MLVSVLSRAGDGTAPAGLLDLVRAAVATVLLPLLPPDRADRVRAAQAVVERALALARVAVTAAELRAAIGAAEAGIAALVDAADA